MAESDFAKNYIEEMIQENTIQIEKEAFKKHMKDILEYRTMEYYRKRYEEKDDLQIQR